MWYLSWRIFLHSQLIFQKPFRGVRYSQCCQDRYSSLVYAFDFAMFLNWQEQQKHWRYFWRAEVQFGEQFKSNPMVTCGKNFSFWNGKSERVNFLVQKYIVTNLAISLDRLIFQTGTPHVEGLPSWTWWLNLETKRRCCNLQYWLATKANLSSKS